MTRPLCLTFDIVGDLILPERNRFETWDDCYQSLSPVVKISNISLAPNIDDCLGAHTPKSRSDVPHILVTSTMI